MSRRSEPKPHRTPITLVIFPDEQSAQVTVDGQPRMVYGSTPKETRRAALDIASRHAASLDRPVLVDARDANGAWQLIITPTGVVRAASAADSKHVVRPGQRTKGSGRGRRAVLAVAGGGLAVAALTGGGVVAVQAIRDGTITQIGNEPESAATFSARPAPPGYGRAAEWRLPMMPGTRPAVAPDSTRAAFVDPNGKLVVITPDGTPDWTADLPADPQSIEGPLFVAEGDGNSVVVVADGKMWWWGPKGGKPDEIDLPSGAEVTFAGTTPLAITGERAHVVVDRELRPVSLPSGSGALLADGDEALAAVVRGPWTWVSPGNEEGTSVEPATPPKADALDEVLTARADYVIVRWTAQEQGKAVLAVHDSRDGSVIASAAASPDALADAQWVEGDGTAAYGPVVVDLDQGSATVVNGLEPKSAAGDLVFGELDGGEVAVKPDGTTSQLEDDTARPWGLLDGRAVVVANSVLFALTPE